MRESRGIVFSRTSRFRSLSLSSEFENETTSRVECGLKGIKNHQLVTDTSSAGGEGSRYRHSHAAGLGVGSIYKDTNSQGSPARLSDLPEKDVLEG
jgi:hypothetical protein